MQFASRKKRQFWLFTFVGLVPDAIIAVVVAILSGYGLLGFIVVFIALQLLYVTIWLKQSIASWLFFAVYARRQMASHLRDFLASREFPEPSGYHSSAGGYLDDVASDDELVIAVRLAAALESGALGYSASSGKLQEHLQLSMSWEDAVILYKRSFRGIAS